MALFASKDTPAPRAQAPRVEATGSVAGGTFISVNAVFEGTLGGSDPVTIEGTVKGKINLTAELRVGVKARVEAGVHARSVTIEGKLTGDVSADERVELVASASVDGNIKAPKVVVAEGAKFRGSVDMGSTKPKESGPEPANSKK